MSIVVASAPDPRSSGARRVNPAATFGSAGAVITWGARGHKHRVPPGPKKFLSNTLIPTTWSWSGL